MPQLAPLSWLFFSFFVFFCLFSFCCLFWWLKKDLVVMKESTNKSVKDFVWFW